MKSRSISVKFAAVFVTVVIVAVFLGRISPILLAVYVGLSVVTFFVYWSDKSAAIKGKWRTPESTLHLLALAGGWPGAALAQETLRHKSKKQSFRIVFWVTVIINCTAFAFLFSEAGADFLQKIT